jgi:hypothetical protein
MNRSVVGDSRRNLLQLVSHNPQCLRKKKKSAIINADREKTSCYIYLEPKTIGTVGVWNVSLKNNTIPIPTNFLIGVFSDVDYFYFRVWSTSSSSSSSTTITMASEIQKNPNYNPIIDTFSKTETRTIGENRLRSEMVYNKKTGTLETLTDSLINDAEFFAILQVILFASMNNFLDIPMSFKICNVGIKVIENLKEVFEKHWKLPLKNNFYLVENRNEFFSLFQKVPNCIVSCKFV